ncbi:cobyrinate a,c-diamide synthase [Kineosporia sp. J2-2]|uniref:Hydrogenobyrinate a,c-diamide synthase n=1 Tax=Kineosporia corallincola TaxID=2835133 RepID=A0ABS5TEU8_9ACTN|nr:cobyrinate a,c-diamide synthase [Kineosporia corallincola]MBT0769358.1 cobyrinate a,c-diamide synthase [Kineosporia corallincola]
MTARIVVAAPASGHGKTSVATGLLAAFAARGLVVSPHKVGPDYIDPGYHALAAGRPGRTLDPWLVGEERLVPLFEHAVSTPVPADLAVIEGVMGLYDGAAGRGEFASTAHVARVLDAPVLLVVDSTAMGRSVAALVKGFAGFDPRIRVGGVILNRVGSDRHEMILREALGELGIPVLGAIRRHDALATPSRHLGLVPAAERSQDAVDVVRGLGAVVAEAVDLDAVLALARSAPALSGAAWNPDDEITAARLRAAGLSTVDQAETGPHTTGVRPATSSPAHDQAGRAGRTGFRPVIAMAGGAAFTFSYAETAELLTAAGAEVVRFDPRVDEALPEGTTGLVVGGGFPEVYAEELSANEPLRNAVAAQVRAGAAIVAECAGLLYLARSLDDRQMCGVLATDARMTGRLTLGYREATAMSDSVLADAGSTVRGHEFHRTACSPGTGTSPAWEWAAPDGTRHQEGFVMGNVHASYLHLHWASMPGAALRFTEAARANAVTRGIVRTPAGAAGSGREVKA